MLKQKDATAIPCGGILLQDLKHTLVFEGHNLPLLVDPETSRSFGNAKFNFVTDEPEKLKVFIEQNYLNSDPEKLSMIRWW